MHFSLSDDPYYEAKKRKTFHSCILTLQMMHIKKNKSKCGYVIIKVKESVIEYLKVFKLKNQFLFQETLLFRFNVFLNIRLGQNALAVLLCNQRLELFAVINNCFY